MAFRGTKQNTNGLDKNPQNINRNGRPKKNFSALNEQLKKLGYKVPARDEYYEAIGYLIVVSEEDRDKIIDDKENPIWLRDTAKDLKHKTMGSRIRGEYRDWMYGKAEQKTDITSGGKPLSSLLSELDGKKG